MNVFVLCTGRCGSVTFIKSAEHIENYSAGHETRSYETGSARFAYPQDHIEADNRLSWFLGRLDAAFGDNAFYVHLVRDREATARSFLNRYDRGIIAAYCKDILMGAERKNKAATPFDKCLDYYDTVNANIAHFLRDKSRKLEFRTEGAKARLGDFWDFIGADGDFEAALAEWDRHHNASE